jgi:hypothetical protein
MADEFIRAGLVVGKDARCPEGSIQDSGIEDVLGGFGDGSFGRVIDTKGNPECEWEVHCLVSGVLDEGEGMGTHDVGGREGGARAVAGWNLHRGGIDEADEGASDINGDVFREEEPRVVATVPDEELLFDSGVRVGECAALWLEDGPDMLVRCDNVEACKEAVAQESNVAFRDRE